MDIHRSLIVDVGQSLFIINKIVEEGANSNAMKHQEKLEAHVNTHRDHNQETFTPLVKLAIVKVCQVMISIIQLMRMQEARVAQRAEHAQELSVDNKTSSQTSLQ